MVNYVEEVKHTYVGIPLSAAIKLGNVGNVEAFRETSPYLWPQSVAKHQPHVVESFFRTFWRAE